MAIFTTLLVAGAVYAAEPGGADISDELDLGNFPTATSTDSVDLTSGSITQANLNTTQSTFRWVGLLGNVTGNIVLGDSASNILYQWTARGNIVFASEAATINWSGLVAGSVANAPGYLTTTASDNYTNTFDAAPTLLPSNIFTGITAPAAETTGGWETLHLYDGTENIWAGIVRDAVASYRGDTVDFQMIIPEDGVGGDTTPTTYNLWVELE